MAERNLKRRKISIPSRIILYGNILFVFLLLLTYLSSRISPEQNWLIPFFGLAYPYLLIINILFSFYWLLRFRYFFIISLIGIGIGWNFIGRYIQFNKGDFPPESSSYFRITSYNVKNLSNSNLKLDDPEIRNKIKSFLQADGADILCMQEFMVRGNNPEDSIRKLGQVLSRPYYSFAQYFEKNKNRIDAIITYSRYPILKSFNIKKDNSHSYAIITDLLIEGDTIRLFNIHLESIRFQHEDYDFMNELEQKIREEGKLRQGSKAIFSKLRIAFGKRADQVRNLRRLLDNSPYPVILCGDFNDTPSSYAYEMLSEGLTDSFMESGKGTGNTYAGVLPSYRIDFILHNDLFKSYRYTTGHIALSDHYPVSCFFARN